MDINIGDNVRWESQALGCYTSKKGTVITKAGEKTHGFNRVDDSLILQVVK